MVLSYRKVDHLINLFFLIIYTLFTINQIKILY
jgi:hypothetical protein